MIGNAIAYIPCAFCERKEMCSMCELTLRRNQIEWISVEERLPEVEQVVLCCLGLVQNVYTYKGDNTWEDSYGYWQKDEPITHWMPLPMPPKGR